MGTRHCFWVYFHCNIIRHLHGPEKHANARSHLFPSNPVSAYTWEQTQSFKMRATGRCLSPALKTAPKENTFLHRNYYTAFASFQFYMHIRLSSCISHFPNISRGLAIKWENHSGTQLNKGLFLLRYHALLHLFRDKADQRPSLAPYWSPRR